jgi:hypothetical protein
MSGVPKKLEDPRLEALSWKARLYLRVHRIRRSTPGRLVERIVWWFVG